MAGEPNVPSDAPPRDAPGAGRALPYSWIKLGIGLAALVVAATVCAVCLARFMTIRPLNLRAETDVVADAFEELLLANRVPAGQIRRSAGGLMADGAAAWHVHGFEVEVPDSLSLNGLVELVQRNMLRRNVAASSVRRDDGALELGLYLGAYQFATAVFRSAAASSPRAGENGQTVLAASNAENTGAGVNGVSTPGGGQHDELPPIQLPTLAQAIRDLDLNEILSITLPKPDEIELESSGIEEPELGKAPLASSPAGAVDKRVAIVVDDGGYGGAVTEAILALDPGLSLAILPNTPYAEETALRAARLGFEVLLHMPMERARFPGRITTDMTAAQIRELTENALSQIPGAVGVNNHAGSQFTADDTAMGRFLEAIKPKSLFFLDSRTTAETRAYDLAVNMGIRAASRDIFLDHENNASFFQDQFARLIEVAAQNGEAVAICHFRPNTARSLAEKLPQLKENGIQLVHVSELTR